MLAACCLLLFSCAGGGAPESSKAERCPPLPELPPLATAECLETDESKAFVASLREPLERAATELLVRVSIDATARVGGACAEGVVTRTEWKARRQLGAALPALETLDPAPACLAGRRLDFNRRKAKLAEIDRVEAFCEERVKVTRDTLPSQRARRARGNQLTECVSYLATWVLLYDVGVQQPYVYGKPEVVNPPPVPGRDTASRCGRERDFEARTACVEAEGWELLD